MKAPAMPDTFTIAILGATGAVGREMLTVLGQRRFPVRELRALGSGRSAGTRLPFAGAEFEVREATADSFAGVDIALFSAGAGPARELAPAAVEAGAIVIDNSSAFRMDPGVPLVVPEINGHLLAPLRAPGDRSRCGAIVANPNCSAIILLMALEPLRRRFGVRGVTVSTYQAASGAGIEAMDELRAQTADVLAGREPRPQVFPEPCAFNVFSHNTPVDPATGLNVEEQKVIEEARKIWGQPGLAVCPTCIRVPVLRAHAESIRVAFERPATEGEARSAYEGFAGVRLVDDRARGDFPTSLKASGGDDVLVGRLRPDWATETGDGRFEAFTLFSAGDQLRKGAALNAVQIAEVVCCA
jgi:aspartate-semialdehyde dehydrogenase